MPVDWLSDVAGIDPEQAAPSPTDPDPVPDLLPLERLVLAVEDADELPVAVAAIAAWLADDSTHAGVAAALRASPGPVEGLLVRLGARKGLKQHADRIGAALRKLAKDQEASERRRQRALARERAGGDARDLREVLGRPELPPGLRCPEGWSLDLGGL